MFILSLVPYVGANLLDTRCCASVSCLDAVLQITPLLTVLSVELISIETYGPFILAPPCPPTVSGCGMLQSSFVGALGEETRLLYYSCVTVCSLSLLYNLTIPLKTFWHTSNTFHTTPLLSVIDISIVLFKNSEKKWRCFQVASGIFLLAVRSQFQWPVRANSNDLFPLPWQLFYNFTKYSLTASQLVESNVVEFANRKLNMKSKAN